MDETVGVWEGVVGLKGLKSENSKRNTLLRQLDPRTPEGCQLVQGQEASSFRFIRYSGDPILPDCTLPTCQTVLICPLRCSACRNAHYCVRHLIFLSYWPSCLLANHPQNQACQRADWPRHRAMCSTPERLAAEGASKEVLHPEYKWTPAEMSSTVNSFVSHHTQPIIILAINSLCLFDVPVVGEFLILGCGASGHATESSSYTLSARLHQSLSDITTSSLVQFPLG